MYGYFGLFLALLAADQLVKRWAMQTLAPVGTIEFLPFLRWTYVENRGAAFGLFAGQRWLLSAVSLAVVCACLWAIAKRAFSGRLENVCIALVAAGGAGNLIDRLLRGWVVDYIDINALFSYPMFNLADCCVVVGAIGFAILALIGDRKKKPDEGENDP